MNKPQQDAVYNNKVQRAVNRWKKVLDFSSNSMPSIQNEHVYRTTALLMENQYEHCINEANTTSGIFGNTQPISSPGAMTNTDGYAQGDSRIPKILIPMIRRTFPELISNEICGVQPMAGPVGLAFALRYAYSSDVLSQTDRVGDTTTGTRGYNGPTYTGVDGLSAGPTVNTRNEAGWQFIDTRFTGTSSGQLSGRTGFWEFNAADTGVAQLLSAYEQTGRMPQLEVKFEKTAVQAGTRRIACSWSTELEQDLKNMQNLDIDGEFTNTMSYELQAEIDREVVMRMIQSAFNAGPGAGISIWSPVSADGRWSAERNITFYQRLIVEANRMAARNRRGAANFIIATPRVCAILEMLPDFKVFEIGGTVSTTGVGIAKVGTVGSRFTVYRDTRTEVQNSSVYGDVGYGTGFTNDNAVEYALLGYKGSEYFDTGIIYCPYIPIMIQRAVDPTNFTPRVGMMTRYGIISNIFGSSLYYHIVVVRNLGTAFTPGSVSSYL